jgi:hypothetical protein
VALEDQRIAIIGAGMTGLSCADRLRSHGAKPVVFDKSRGIGGRMATRRAAGGLSFDHGAQYIRSRDGAFSSLLDRLTAEGTVGSWSARRFDETEDDNRALFVGVPAMNTLLKPLTKDLDLRLNCQVSSVLSTGAGWIVSTEESVIGTFDTVVMAVPADQARNLLVRQEALLSQIQKVEIWPCWSLMVALEAPVDCAFDQWRYVSGELGWIARNSSKPGRDSAECWVVHARPEWSIENLERSKEDMCAEMLAMFNRVMGEASGTELPAVIHAAAHRWRYAQTATPLGQAFVQSEDGSLLVGGDWTLGARIECAFESGVAMADALLDAGGIDP